MGSQWIVLINDHKQKLMRYSYNALKSPVVFAVLILFSYPQFQGATAYAESLFASKRRVPNAKNAGYVKPWARVVLESVASGFKQPVCLITTRDRTDRIFMVEKAGVIRIIDDNRVRREPFLDIVSRVRSRESERGLLSAAFHPAYKDNGRFYVNYTNRGGDTVIAEYTASKDRDRTDESSERILLVIEQPASNHNGGLVKFGPDGFLYIGMGDGGRGGDPWGNAQNKNVLLGKMLRIDVDGQRPYGIPGDNPFAKDSRACPEIWAYGLRNPWRFSFDSATNDLYIADVGQNLWEWVHYQAGSSRGGQNYGWNRLEGFHKFDMPEEMDLSGYTLPVLEYGHDVGCSITGGEVYRGKDHPELSGTYFFSDFCTGTIWGLRMTRKHIWEWAKFLDTTYGVSSFGVDSRGELYVIDYYGGSIYRIALAE